MGRRPLEDRFKRNILAIGQGSLCVTIPREHLLALGWEKGKEVEVLLDEKKGVLTISEVQAEKSAKKKK